MAKKQRKSKSNKEFKKFLYNKKKQDNQVSKEERIEQFKEQYKELREEQAKAKEETNNKLKNLLDSTKELKRNIYNYKKGNSFELVDFQTFMQQDEVEQKRIFSDLYHKVGNEILNLNDKNLEYLEEHNIKSMNLESLKNTVFNSDIAEQIIGALGSENGISPELRTNMAYLYKDMYKLINSTTFTSEGREKLVNYYDSVEKRVHNAYEAYQLNNPNSHRSYNEFKDNYWRLIKLNHELNSYDSGQLFNALDTGELDVFDQDLIKNIDTTIGKTLAKYDIEDEQYEARAERQRVAREKERKKNTAGLDTIEEYAALEFQYWNEELDSDPESRPYTGLSITGRTWEEEHPYFNIWLDERSIDWEDPSGKVLFNKLHFKDYNEDVDDISVTGKYIKAINRIKGQILGDDLKKHFEVLRNTQLDYISLMEYVRMLETEGLDTAYEYITALSNSDNTFSSEATQDIKLHGFNIRATHMQSVNSNESMTTDEDNELGDI